MRQIAEDVLRLDPDNADALAYLTAEQRDSRAAEASPEDTKPVISTPEAAQPT